MRLSIHDFSQQVAVDMVDTVTSKDGKERRICIDATDLLILDWFTKFYPNMKKKIIEDREYGWIKRSKLLKDLPILRITEESVSDRLRKLVHFGLLDYKIVKENGTSCYYTYGEKFSTLVSTEYTGQTGSTPSDTPGQPRLGRPGQPGNKDSNSIIDSNLRYKWNFRDQKDHAAKQSMLCPNCGGKIYHNQQTGRYDCPSCLETFPKSMFANA